ALAVLLLLGVACDSGLDGPGTHTYVFNQTPGTIKLDLLSIDPTYSRDILVEHGAVDTFVLVDRLEVERRLVVTSLVPAGDPGHYEAGINIHENQAGMFYVIEYSPYIDIEVTAP
ncbi:MAG: hypothetical protein R6X13_01210, partial [bacterium]